MTSLFTKETLANSIFKWEELAGKELAISVGSLGEGMHLTVLGVDKTSGKYYVLVNKFRRFQ